MAKIKLKDFEKWYTFYFKDRHSQYFEGSVFPVFYKNEPVISIEINDCYGIKIQTKDGVYESFNGIFDKEFDEIQRIMYEEEIDIFPQSNYKERILNLKRFFFENHNNICPNGFTHENHAIETILSLSFYEVLTEQEKLILKEWIKPVFTSYLDCYCEQMYRKVDIDAILYYCLSQGVLSDFRLLKIALKSVLCEFYDQKIIS